MSGSVPGFEISMTISDGTKLIFQCTSTGALYATKKDGKQNLVWKIQPQHSLSRFDDIVVSSGIGSVGFSWKRLPNEYRLYFHVDGIKVAYLTATFPEQRLSLSHFNVHGTSKKFEVYGYISPEDGRRVFQLIFMDENKKLLGYAEVSNKGFVYVDAQLSLSQILPVLQGGDLNNYKTTCITQCFENTKNTPVASWGICLTLNAGNYISQIYINNYNMGEKNERVWVRSFDPNYESLIWSSWIQIQWSHIQYSLSRCVTTRNEGEVITIGTSTFKERVISFGEVALIVDDNGIRIWDYSVQDNTHRVRWD